MSPSPNLLPALLLWCNAWSYPGWQALTEKKEAPKWKQPCIQAWYSSLQHKTSVEAVQKSLVGEKSDEKTKFSREVTRCLKRCSMSHIIDQYMVANNIDAASVAKFNARGVQPTDYKRYVAGHITPLGVTLFGSEAKESPDSPVLPFRLDEVVRYMTKVAYEKQTEQLNQGERWLKQTLSKLNICIEQYEQAVSDSSAVPSGLFTRTSKLLEETKHYLKHVVDLKDRNNAENLLAKVLDILKHAPPKLRGKNAQDATALQEELELARLTYEQEFAQLEADDVEDEQFATDRSLLTHHAAQSGHGFDLDIGVAVEVQLDQDSLFTYLGLQRAKHLPFTNQHRHIKPYLVWTANLPVNQISLKIREALAPDFEPLSLRWHQLVGICAAIRMLSKSATGGILFADDVGIGKTSQTLGILALMMHRACLEQQKPSAVFGALAGLPVSVGPHVIVAPNSLINNWKAEGMMWLNVQVSFTVYQGSLEVRRKLLASQWNNSSIPAYHRVILIPTSIVSKEFQELYGTGSDTVFKDEKNRNLLFVKYAAAGSISTYVIDEAHNLRSRKLLYQACMQLGQAALARVALTATPFVTGPKDMLTIGKVLQIPECSSPAADEIEKDIGSRRGRPIQLSDHKDYVDLCSSTQKVVEEIMDLFGDRIIRRHSGSLQYDGRPIIPLPPLHHVRLKLNMLAHDSQRYQQLMAADTKSKQQLNQFSRQAFYVLSRQGAGQSEYVLWSKHNNLPLPGPYKDLCDFKARASTKSQATATIMNYHRAARDTAEPLSIEQVTGDDALPEVESISGPVAFKGVVFTQFPWLAPPLISALQVNGFSTITLLGSDAIGLRQGIVDRWSAAEEDTILIISTVAMTGLNLSAAWIMVLFVSDQVFSQQDKKQLIGRIHRFPQRLTCIVYDLVTRNTADEALYAIASGKAEMMAALNCHKIQGLMHESIGAATSPATDANEGEDGVELETETSFISAVRPSWKIAASKQKLVRHHKAISPLIAGPVLDLQDVTSQPEPMEVEPGQVMNSTHSDSEDVYDFIDPSQWEPRQSEPQPDYDEEPVIKSDGTDLYDFIDPSHWEHKPSEPQSDYEDLYDYLSVSYDDASEAAPADQGSTSNSVDRGATPGQSELSFGREFGTAMDQDVNSQEEQMDLTGDDHALPCPSYQFPTSSTSLIGLNDYENQNFETAIDQDVDSPDKQISLIGDDHALPSSSYQFPSNSTIQIGSTSRWSSSNVLGKRRTEPEADEPEMVISRRRVAGSVWGAEIRSGRAAVVALGSRHVHGHHHQPHNESRFTRREQAEALAAIDQAGGIDNFLDKLMAKTSSRGMSSQDGPRTQPSSFYRF